MTHKESLIRLTPFYNPLRILKVLVYSILKILITETRAC